MLRITAKIGLLADMSGVRRTRSRRKLALVALVFAGEGGLRDLAPQGLHVLLADADARGPCPVPGTGCEVRAGQAITMFSPRPRWFLTMRFCSASPNETSSDTDTVPQVMPNSVRSVRIFWCRTSCSICRRKDSEVIVTGASPPGLLDLLAAGARRPVLLPCRPSDDLDVDAVGEADLDLLLDRLAVSRRPAPRPWPCPRAKVTSRSGRSSTSVFSRTTMSALAE